MDIIKTSSYVALELSEEQNSQISSVESIQTALKKDKCIGFYAREHGAEIGFALFREYDDRQFFLWNFIIDCRHQGCGKGKKFLGLLIQLLTSDFSAEVITTTYIWGNEAAKKLYESLGFTQTDVVCENGIHEVNMMLYAPKGEA